MAEEIIAVGQADKVPGPSHYKDTELNVYKSRAPFAKLRAETDREKEKLKIKRSDEPSPVSYDVTTPWRKFQTSSINNIKFVKQKRPGFTDEVERRARKLPGVGKYDVTKSDRIQSKPMRKSFR